MSEAMEVTEMLDVVEAKMCSGEAEPQRVHPNTNREVMHDWWDPRKPAAFSEYWKRTNDYFLLKQEAGYVDLEEWEKQLGIAICVNLSPWATPSSVQRCVDVIQRTSAKAAKNAAIDLMRDRHTPLEKRLAVLEYRARIHLDLINKKKAQKASQESASPANEA